MENPYNYLGNNQEHNDSDDNKSKMHRYQFIKKMVVLASSILSIPMVIFIIIFAFIWHNMSSDFNRRHEAFQATVKQWDKDFKKDFESVHELNKNFHRSFEEGRLKAEKEFQERSKRLDQDIHVEESDADWDEKIDRFFDHSSQTKAKTHEVKSKPKSLQ